MFGLPSAHHQLLKDKDLINQVYTAMNSDDYADVVMAAMEALEKSCGFPQIPKVYKCESQSNKYRNEGNIAFQAGNMTKALECYNRALVYAPKSSRAMKLAYSNLSAIFEKQQQFNACKVDIQHCFQLGCPPDIIGKLRKRMESIYFYSDIQTEAIKQLQTYFADSFKFDSKRNAQIPCVSANIEVVRNKSSIKIVAAKDIKVGTLLALEPSFVSCNNDENVIFACHYCHKMSLNLIPCDGCCFVLFCNEECKKLCLKEFHSIECQIMEIIVIHTFSPMIKLMIKGAIKIVQMCESWKEVNTISHCTGSKRISTSSVQEIFDVRNKVSVLSYNDDRLFIHGLMYNASFVCATIIECLEKVPSFCPRSLGEKKIAKQALGRLLMYFALYAIPTQVPITVSNRKLSITYTNPHANYGWYPFVGKLRNSCTPNVIVSNLNKTAALIALQPIEKGTELTVSYMGHYLNIDIDVHLKNCRTFGFIGKVCKCYICNGDWKLQTVKSVLTEKQRNMYINKFLPILENSNIATMNHLIPKLFEVMACLRDVPFSMEYKDVFTLFHKFILAYEECEGNITLGLIPIFCSLLHVE